MICQQFPSRRGFFQLVAAGLIARSFPASAQQSGQLPVIGMLWHRGNQEEEAPFFEWTRQGFAQQGYVEGKNIKFIDCYAAELPERFDSCAAELVERKVDVLVAISVPSSLAAKKATSTIPIVFVPPADPVAFGLVSNLARPGGNITGLSSMASDLFANRVQYLSELLPGVSRVALIIYPFTAHNVEEDTEAYRAAGKRYDILIEPVIAKELHELRAAFSNLRDSSVSCAIVAQAPLYFPLAGEIAKMSLSARVATMTPAGLFADAGCLLSYSADFAPLYRDVASYARRILNGEKPGDLPVQQPRSFELVLNMKTAAALRLTIQPSFLARIDRVIE